MRKNILASVALAATLVSGSAFAGQFELWTDSAAKGGNRTLIVSFAGDGQTQDSQADIAYDSSLEFVSASAKVAGSVCVVLAGKGMVRAVPPSGAGQALTSKATDYCAFTFRQKGSQAVEGSGFTVSFTECAATSGVSACGAETVDVSAK